jgi:endonuclease/exonuclease/phosphatase family metal-dependent hydrolase
MKRIFIVAALAAMALCCSCSDAKSENEIVAMSFNIRLSLSDDFDGENSWVLRREAVVEMINEVNPDLFGIQEGLLGQVNYMGEHLPEYGFYGVARNDGPNTGESNAVFYKKSRFELLKSTTFWLSETPDEVSVGWDAAFHRIVTMVRLLDKNSGQEFYFYNTHFDHVGKIARKESGKLIVERMKSIIPDDAAVVLTGDFNAGHNDPILDPIEEYMTSARRAAPVTDSLNTFNSWGKIAPEEGGKIIDHIYFRNLIPSLFKTLTCSYAGVDYISDHYPVIAVFTLKDAQSQEVRHELSK